MQERSIIKSPAGPLAWELCVEVRESGYPDFRSFSVPEPKFPEIRLTRPLPIPINDEACRFARHGHLQAFLVRYPT